MMWLVRLALNRPYTFVVASMLILILSVVAILRTPTDIFPDINIPVVSVLWSYTGLAPEDIEQRMVGLYERFATTVVNDIEHIESQSYFGIGVIKIFLQQGADINGAIAQATATGQAAIRQMPPGTTPPLVIADPTLNLAPYAPPTPSAPLSTTTLSFGDFTSYLAPGSASTWHPGASASTIAIDVPPANGTGAGDKAVALATT